MSSYCLLPSPKNMHAHAFPLSHPHTHERYTHPHLLYVHTHSHLHVYYTSPMSQDPPLNLDLTVEPSFIALGPFHIAVGMNDRAWIHEIGEQGE